MQTHILGVKVWLGGIIKNNLINKILKIGQEILERKPKEISFLFSYCYIYVTKGFDYLQANM
jgi:hypothetical protein